MLSELNPDLLHPVSSDEFLPPISRWTTLGGLFLVSTFGIAIALAASTQYQVTVKAAATVRPTGEIRIVQAALEGNVKNIQVTGNQVVKKGDMIATIDDSQLQTKKKQLRGNIQQSQLQLTQIDAQLKALQTQITAESNSMQRAITSAQADLSRNQRDYKDRQIITQAEVQEANAALELAQEALKRYQQLGNTGAIAQLQIKEKEEAFKAAQARLQRAKAGLNPSAATVAIAQERIAQEQARGESTLATLNKEQQELIRRQVEINNQISRDTQELQQIETELKKSVVRAPVAGTILQPTFRTSR